MKNLTKIATCSYCSSRTVLRLVGQARHELACANCGAPLSEMKPMRMDRAQNAKRSPRTYPVSARTRRKPQKRVKRDWRYWDDLWDDVWDSVEDFFDDIEDWFD